MAPNVHAQRDKTDDYYGMIRLHKDKEYLVCPLCDKLICPLTNLDSEPCHHCKIRVLPPKEYIEEHSFF